MEETVRPLGEVDDAALATRGAAGDREALGELFSRYAAPVRKIVTSIGGPTPELDDLVQDVFLRAYGALSRFEGRSQFSTWLFRIAVNTVVDHIRKPRRLVLMTTVTEVEGQGGDLHREVEGREMVRRMYAILDTMSAKRRVVVSLFEFQGLSLKAIAKMLGVPEAVVKSRLFFARRELRRKAGEDPLLATLLEEMSI